MRCLSTHRLRWLLAFSVAALLAFAASGAGTPPTARAASAQLAFSPSPSSVAIGGNAAVNITVANVSNLGGYDVHVQFNPAIVHVTSLEDTGFVTGGGNIVVCNPATIDNSAGTATAACATVSPFGTPGPGVSTTGPTALMQATFTGMATGTSSLTLTGTTLEDPNGNPIAAKLATGSITTTAAGVGGVTKLVDGSALPPQANAAEPGRQLYTLIAIAAGLLAAIAAGAGYAARRHRSRAL